MNKVRVNALKPYDIYIGDGLLDDVGSLISGLVEGEIAAIITDDNVASLYPERLLKSLRKKSFETAVFTIKNGEASKNPYSFINIAHFLAENKLTKADTVIAFGGGVVGDLAGFAASVYLRGIPYIQIPTTLLAAVDSSVGGKTGIDLEAGKNLVGSFYQPLAVVCDLSILEALPPKIIIDGCSEIIKYGAILSEELFNKLKLFPKIDFEDIITSCVKIKADIVAHDEFEAGRRKLLNFGHTVGHAIEHLSNYSISHGTAVAIGMAIEMGAGYEMGVCDLDSYNELINLLHRFGLPYTTKFNAQELANAALSDKKRRADTITLVFPQKIGSPVMRTAKVVDLEEIIFLGLKKVGECI